MAASPVRPLICSSRIASEQPGSVPTCPLAISNPCVLPAGCWARPAQPLGQGSTHSLQQQSSGALGSLLPTFSATDVANTLGIDGQQAGAPTVFRTAPLAGSPAPAPIADGTNATGGNAILQGGAECPNSSMLCTQLAWTCVPPARKHRTDCTLHTTAAATPAHLLLRSITGDNRHCPRTISQPCTISQL